MLKNITMRKIGLIGVLLCITLLFAIFPNEDKVNLDGKEDISYVDDINTHEIYMVNKDNYVAKTNVVLKEENIENKVRTLIEYLIVDGKNEDNVPNGFRSIIPSDTIINNISFEDGIVLIDFSKEILEIEKTMEIKMYESIVYTLTSIPEIKGIKIYVDGEELKILPKTNTNLPNILDRNFGINKQYDINSTDDITKTTVYYIGKNNDEYYYVPITKINNDNNDKVNIIIEELTNTNLYDNLMSFLNINTKLLNYELKDNDMYLTFNEYVYNSIENKEILEEVVNTITYSIKDNYNVENVIFTAE